MKAELLVDQWDMIGMNKNFNQYTVADIYSITNNNTYIGSDAIYDVQSRSLLRLFNPETITPSLSSILPK